MKWDSMRSPVAAEPRPRHRQLAAPAIAVRNPGPCLMERPHPVSETSPSLNLPRTSRATAS
jgi:hypothetical protein